MKGFHKKEETRLSVSEVTDMIIEIDKEGEGLTPFEIDFIASFIDHPVVTYTEKQRNMVARIYNQRVRREI